MRSLGPCMYGMPFGAELMSPSEYPQLPLVHIHATAAPARRLRRSLVYSQDIWEEKREREREGGRAVDISGNSIGRPLADSEEGREGGREEAREEVVDVK